MLLNHIIDEKIIYSTCGKSNKSNGQPVSANPQKIEKKVQNVEIAENKPIKELPEKKVRNTAPKNHQNGAKI